MSDDTVHVQPEKTTNQTTTTMDPIGDQTVSSNDSVASHDTGESDADDLPIAHRKGKRERRKPAYLTSGEYVTNMQTEVVEPSKKEKLDLVRRMLDLLNV